MFKCSRSRAGAVLRCIRAQLIEAEQRRMFCFVADGMGGAAAARHCALRGSHCDISRLSTVEGKKRRKAVKRGSTRAAQGDVSPPKLSVPVGRRA